MEGCCKDKKMMAKDTCCQEETEESKTKTMKKGHCGCC